MTVVAEWLGLWYMEQKAVGSNLAVDFFLPLVDFLAGNLLVL